jgi:drug/metabolite transporter (DMT)-like permease
VFAVALSVVAAGTWGMSDFLAGLTARRIPVLVVIATMQCSGLAMAALMLVVFRPAVPGLDDALAALAAGGAGTAGLVCFYRALASGTMSIVAPVAAAGVTLPVIVGLADGDRLRGLQGVGLALTVVGVVLASRSAPEAAVSDLHPARAPQRLGSIALALMAAVGFGAFFAFGHAGARGGVLWLVGLSHLAVLPLVAGLWLTGRPALPSGRRDGGLLAGLGLIDLAATSLYGIAQRHGALALVSVAGSLYPVVTVLMARIVLHERVLRVQGAGVLAALAGVVLLAAG